MVKITKKIYIILLPFLMAVILLSLSCTPSVRYTRPSASSTGYKRPSNQSSNKTEKSSTAVKNDQDTTSDEYSDDNNSSSIISSVSDNCNVKKTINKYIGIPYKYGGVDRRGMDCSGLVYRVLKDLGVKEFVRTSSEVMFTMGSSVSKRKIVPGDLVFFKKRGRINHVGIYVGNGEFAHASSTIGVSYTTLNNEYFKNKYAGARRIYKCQ